jgi:hypothetical protein
VKHSLIHNSFDCNTELSKTWNRIISFFIKDGACEENAVIISELASCYHNVKHSVIYNSFDCNTKLSHYVFSDLKVRSKLSHRGTRAYTIVVSVLTPSSITDFLETL